MKKLALLVVPLTFIFILECNSNAFATDGTQEISASNSKNAKENLKESDDTPVDRSVRTSPYASTPSYAQGGDQSRYSTSSGWSRGNYFGYRSWWGGGGGRSSDLPTSGYTAPSGRK